LVPKRAAIYARFSSDRQRDRSIDDQVALCQTLADRNGWTVTTVYADYAASGSTIHRRREFSRMLADTEEHQFEVIISEDIDRLARGEGDAPKLRQRLEFLGVEIHTCTDGHVTKLHAGLKGLMSSLFLDNLVAHTKRGMAGVVRDGRHPGGKSYGYRAIAGCPGELEIIEEEAAIVRRIFERYLGGQTPRHIAGELNKDHILPPRGGETWRASTINGNKKRGNGILQNELYTGVIVWNRMRMMRDPSTGRRVSRPNEASEHQRVNASHLRIISTELFKAAQERKTERAHASHHTRKRAKRLLSGLLRCGCCGGGMSVASTRQRARIVCTKTHEAGTCENRRYYYLEEIERRVIDGLRDNLGTREAITYFVDLYNAKRRKASATARIRSADLERKLAASERELKRAIDGMIRGTISEAEADQVIPELRRRRDRLAAEMDSVAKPPKVMKLHPPSVDEYLEAIEALSAFANGLISEKNDRMSECLRKFIDSVTVMPAARGEKPEVRLAGALASLLPPASRHSVLPGAVVAGARFTLTHRHAPFRLTSSQSPLSSLKD
jgi:site-specific DNA recombinase